jgi:hypothetical protein
MFYAALSTDFSTAYVEKCFEEVARKKVSGFKFQVKNLVRRPAPTTTWEVEKLGT